MNQTLLEPEVQSQAQTSEAGHVPDVPERPPAPVHPRFVKPQRVAFVQSSWHRDVVEECRIAFLEEIEARHITRAQVDLLPYVLQLAKETKKPVKLIWTREQDVKSAKMRPMTAHYMQAGLDEQGNIVAWKHKLVGEAVTGYIAPARLEACGERVASMATLSEACARVMLPLPLSSSCGLITWMRLRSTSPSVRVNSA